MLTKRRAIVSATVALLLTLLLAACDDAGGTPTPTVSPSATDQPTATTSATPPSTPRPASNEPPERDLMDLARRYLGLPADAPRVARTEPFGHQVGDSVTFNLFDLNVPSEYQVTATVRAISEHAYFFIQDGTPYSEPTLQQIAADFEAVVWPTVTSTFGEPWTPGVDGDPRITVLHAALRGAGGYVSSTDAFPRSAVPRSNEREMLYIDRGALSTPGVAYNDLVAHELQHLIHGHADAGEESWVNEGLSQVAGQLVGGSEAWIPQFLAQPDLQLTFWPSYSDSVAHYAAAELFFSYLLGHYGSRANAGTLIGEQGDGFDGVETYLEAFGVTFDEVFADWAAANWIDADDGPYSHPSLSARTSFSHSIAPGDNGAGDVHQYGTDYFRAESGTFRFDGADVVSIGVPEHDGAFWWSGRGDSIDSRLTRRLDLRNVGDATLRFDTWYDIERDWDYAYVSASTDGGATWRALPGERTTAHDPTSASYGHAYTGMTGGWVSETVDLTDYAGQQPLIRFEYVTDAGANLAGFAISNIEVPEIGFTDAAESEGGWSAEGFQIVDGPLEQRFIVQVIGDAGDVRQHAPGADNIVEFDIGGPVTIAISGSTRGTAEPAPYSWSLSP